jgi:hypothetical protein
MGFKQLASIPLVESGFLAALKLLFRLHKNVPLRNEGQSTIKINVITMKNVNKKLVPIATHYFGH